MYEAECYVKYVRGRVLCEICTRQSVMSNMYEAECYVKYVRGRVLCEICTRQSVM